MACAFPTQNSTTSPIQWTSAASKSTTRGRHFPENTWIAPGRDAALSSCGQKVASNQGNDVKKPLDSRGFFICATSSLYGAGAWPRIPHAANHVGEFCGFVSQYIRVSNLSTPWSAIAALTFAPFTDTSVIEYSSLRGILLARAAGPGCTVAGWHVRRHSAHA